MLLYCYGGIDVNCEWKTSGSRGMLFYRLLGQATGVDTVTYNDIIERKGEL